MSELANNRKKVRTDMTQGSILHHVVKFALPLILGNLCQQLYNLADTWVVGHYLSADAFSAVGSVGAISKLIISIFMGFTSGAGVVLAQYYGSGDDKKLKDATHTAVLFFLIASLVLAAVGTLCVPWMLKITGVPDDIYDLAKEYLTIILEFVSFSAIYNMGTAILRAVGDSKKPFYFLVATAVANVALDLLFVIVFQWGVAGAAYATIISQAISAVLVIRELLITSHPVRITIKDLRFYKGVVPTIVKLGVPFMLQSSLINISNVMVTSYVNKFGKMFLGGFTVYNKLDGLFFMVGSSFGIATSTFVGQNVGANKPDRAKTSVKISLIINWSIWAISCMILELFPSQIAGFFNPNPEIIAYATSWIRICTPFFGLYAFSQVNQGAMQGLGNSRTPAFISIMSIVVARQVFLYLAINHFWFSTTAVILCYPISWIVSFTCWVFLSARMEFKSHLNS